MDPKTEYQKWLTSPFVSEEMKEELKAIADREDEIRMRFSSPLAFGTAGLRGIMAAGLADMNVHTVAQATQGLADFIVSQGGGRAVVAYDTRNNSRLFAETTAEVLAGNGVEVFLFDGPRPTPELSFAVRHLSCVAGVNITASHNPKEYNGYKAYGADGAQLGPEQADAVSAFIGSHDIFEGIERIPYKKGVSAGRIRLIGKEIDEAYLSRVLEQRVDVGAF